MTTDNIHNFIKNIKNKYDIFHGQDSQAYIVLPYKDNSQNRTVMIDSQYFRDFMELKYSRQYHKYLTSSVKSSVINYLSAYARNLPEQEKVFRRVGFRNNTIYIDQVADGKTYKICKQSIKSFKKVKCKFNFNKTTLQLPKPDLINCDIEPLWDLLNITDQHEQQLLLVWILNSFYTITNYPVLVFYGDKGTAKSTSQKYIKNLIDPSTNANRASPRKPDTLAISAANSHVIDYNNMSKLSKHNQDDICMISTGGTFANRQNYSDRDEVSSDLMRPMMLNGISPFIKAEDLLDRCIIFNLNVIGHNQRKTEVELDEYFQQHHNKLLGWIFNTLQKILSHIDTISDFKAYCRMTDFAKFGLAVERVLDWEKGSFKKAYLQNIHQTKYRTISRSKVARAIVRLKKNDALPYIGTFKGLLNAFKENGTPIKSSEKSLSEDMKRAKEYLNKVHRIKIVKLSRSNQGNRIRITVKQ